ncbi:Ankyrin repeat-containing domain protein [Elaphomyces granulatus]
MPLFDLPVEIILNIADYLDDVAMNALVRTNKDAHSLLNETLYRQAMIRWDTITRWTSWDTTNKSHNMSLLRWAAENGVIVSFHIALQVATVKGHVPIVELLLKVEGINPNIYGGSLQSPLLMAASRGNSAIVELLLAKVNIDPDVRHHEHNNFSPLLYACLGGHVSIVRQLLARDDVDVNCRGRRYLGYQGNTPLTAACSGRNTEIISLLLTKHGIDVNEGNHDGNTPLMIAVVNNRVEGVKSLLARADVDPNIPNRSGCTALSHAASDCPFEPGALEMSKILLERDDIDINLGRDYEGRTALSWACINGCLELVDLILKKDNVDPNVRDYTGCTPLVEACRSTHSRAGVEPLEISKILLERDDIDVNLGRDYKGRTALSWACINGCLELVDLILKKDNIDPNIRDNTGRTPLAEACRSSVKPAVIRSLLSHRDIHPNTVDNNGVSPLAHFVKNYCLNAPPQSIQEIEALLLTAGAISDRRIYVL